MLESKKVVFKKRLEGGGRKLTDEDIEEKVLNCIHERRDNRLRVSRKLIMNKAKILYDESVGDMMSVQKQHLLRLEVG